MKKVIGGVTTVIVVIGLIWYFLYSQAIPGLWTLIPEESSFHFSSTKNSDLTEQHSIRKLAGEADYTGDFVIRLDLTSVDTGIEIRDQRMRDFLFETGKYPVARIAGKFKLGDVAELETGMEEIVSIPFTLTLHGVEKDMKIKVRIFRAEWRKVVLRPAEAVVIEAEDFHLAGGLETLRGLAGLESISPEVSITFELVFKGDSNLKVN